MEVEVKEHPDPVEDIPRTRSPVITRNLPQEARNHQAPKRARKDNFSEMSQVLSTS